jgi:flagellin
MGIRINTNVSSLNTQRHLYNTTVMFAKSMEKLSSGLRINRAGDDAAGLAISEGLKSDIRALQQATRNAADGISLVQTAEGALDEVSNILLRLRELAEQSLNGTLTDTERGYLDAEYQDLMDEIDRISDTTEFNGVTVLDGTLGINIQVGIGTAAADQITITQATDLDAAGIGLTTGVDTAANAATAMDEILAAIDVVSGARSDFGSVQNRLETSIRNINNTTENLSAANSRIRDVDIAAETSTMTSYQILQQAGVSVLAQANLSQGLALSLLSI